MKTETERRVKTIRREPTLLSTDVWVGCWLLGRSKSGEMDAQGLSRTVTADEVADTLLYETLREKHPEIFEHITQRRKMEAELIKKLGTKGSTDAHE